MTQEDKELLLKDLCARLPYKVMCACGKFDAQLKLVCPDGDYCILQHSPYEIETIKPYLRPMSSMTEEEKLELYRYYCKEVADSLNNSNLTWELRCCVSDSFGTDWFNSHHFDYRGLIPKGLALEAPVDMYNSEWK